MEPQDGLCGVSQLRSRLEGLRAYAELVAEQHQAVEAGELDRAEDIAAQRELLQERLDLEADLHPGVTINPVDAEEVEALNQEASRVMIRAAELHTRLVGRLEGLREDTHEDLGGLDRGGPAVTRYLGSKAPTRKGVNIRF